MIDRRGRPRVPRGCTGARTPALALARIAALAIVMALAMSAAPRGAATSGDGAALPPIVFVSRHAIPGGPRAGVPGLGSRQRAAVTGGRLLVRRPDGKVLPLVAPERFFDVSDPSVSFDGRRVAFAAVTRADSAWRIWCVDADGRNLVPLTRTDRSLDLSRFGKSAKRLRRYDDLDPCWLPDGRVCYSSTRYPYIAEAGGLTSNLWIVDADGTHARRITAERDGADEPAIDPVTGDIVYARWWGSRFRASDLEPSGITMDTTRALPAERVIVWHALRVRLDGQGIRLAGGYPLVRTQTMAYQPVLLADGTLAGVTADTLSLEPHPGRVRVVVYPGGFARPVTFPAAPAQMCAPAPLPDGRLLVAYDARGRGDFGLAVVNVDGSGLEPLVDLRGTLELDPVALLARTLPPPESANDLGGLPRRVPARERADLDRESDMVRFDCLNVFANAPVDFPIPDGPPIARDLRIRFYAAYSRPAVAGGDTVALLREAQVTRSGAIHEETIPGDLPMFEQLIDAHGHVLQTASGPAHVPGFNAGRTGAGTRCVGCHTGHTTIEVPLTYAMGKRFNAAPSATVSVTSEAPESHARAVVDRRTRGTWQQVAWVARSGEDEAVMLRWPFALAVDSLVVYGLRPDAAAATDLTLGGCDVTLSREGKIVKTVHFGQTLAPDGSEFDCGGVIADAVEVRPLGARGRVGGVARIGLAEIEAKARIPED